VGIRERLQSPEGAKENAAMPMSAPEILIYLPRC
jgi:hypothetical protein